MIFIDNKPVKGVLGSVPHIFCPILPCVSGVRAYYGDSQGNVALRALPRAQPASGNPVDTHADSKPPEIGAKEMHVLETWKQIACGRSTCALRARISLHNLASSQFFSVPDRTHDTHRTAAAKILTGGMRSHGFSPLNLGKLVAMEITSIRSAILFPSVHANIVIYSPAVLNCRSFQVAKQGT